MAILQLHPEPYYSRSEDWSGDTANHPSFRGYDELSVASELGDWATKNNLRPEDFKYAMLYYDEPGKPSERIAELKPRVIQGRIVFNIIHFKEKDNDR